MEEVGETYTLLLNIRFLPFSFCFDIHNAKYIRRDRGNPWKGEKAYDKGKKLAEDFVEYFCSLDTIG